MYRSGTSATDEKNDARASSSAILARIDSTRTIARSNAATASSRRSRD
ncbi:MAG: hypothetical protein ACRDRP_03260 [Pseudonocardiaceae bacterium]